jgi:xanthine/CO dehydrogenase XdhC/CoxF family maturation factor
MLMFNDATMIGAISGGCLENDVFERATRVMATGLPEFVVYDGTGNDASNPAQSLLDVVSGFGMGCNGITSILIERIEGRNDPFIQMLRETLHERRTRFIATVFDMSEQGILTGLHGFLEENGDILDNFGEHPFAERVRNLVQTSIDAMLNDVSPKNPEPCYVLCEEGTIRAELVVEAMPLPREVVIFGAGYDTLPLLDYASMLGWRTTVLDVRPIMLQAERLKKAHSTQRFHLETIDETVHNLALSPDTAVVVMTHHLERDAEILRAVLPYKPCYCGLLGPKERFKKIEHLWKEREYKVSKELRTPLHTPIGIDIGSETAEEVALSIVAEIQAVFHKRKGGFLKERTRRIHEN